MVATESKDQVRAARAVRVQAAVAAAVACELCPEVTAERGVEILTKTTLPGQWSLGTATTQARVTELIDDPVWRTAALEWIGSYWREHGHGPSWRTFWRQPELWPEGLSMNIRRITLLVMARAGHLDGTKTPFGLRPRRHEDEALAGK